MTTALYRHPVCLRHSAGPGHPENPGRLEAIDRQLEAAGLLAMLDLRLPPAATRAQLGRVHSRAHVERTFGLSPAEGLVHLDGDTAMNPASLQSALFAAGAVVDAVDRVLAGEFARAFCCVRPPGHHAERERAMGFCLFASIAVGAAHALEHHGLDRVAILDFDVHHGNGTEDIFRADERVLFCSSFQHPFYPGTDLTGAPDHIVHTPLAAGTDGAAFREAITADWLPALERHRPQLIFVSAGFDAHRADPLAGLMLDDGDFAWITALIRNSAARYCQGRIVSALEGGYDHAALGRCVARHLTGLADDPGDV